MLKHKIVRALYKSILKPLFFLHDAELVHSAHTKAGEILGKCKFTKRLTKLLFAYEHENLTKEIDGIPFPNPIGLSAGFNYDGQLANILSDVGFGFHTVGTVTAKPYEGNAKPRLGRLPKSKSLLVNKGFKSKGAQEVAKILDSMRFDPNNVLGLSVGSSNVPSVDTVEKAVEDYLFTFDTFKDKDYISYFELNISCPNTRMPESFTIPENFEKLVSGIGELNIKKPIYVKMPNENSVKDTLKLCDIALNHNLNGFIFSNLVKDRKCLQFDKKEIEKMKDLEGNFSGKPTEKNSLLLIKAAREKYGKNVTIIGNGGIFNAEDAIKKFEAGADLVQLITGMIFEGPQLIGEMNKVLGNYLQPKGMKGK